MVGNGAKNQQDAKALTLVRAYAERYQTKGLTAEHPRLVVAMMRDLAGWPVRDASGGVNIAHFSTEEAANAALMTLRREARTKGMQPNGTDRYMLVRDLPKSLQAALDNVGYGKKDIEVKARETFNPVAMGGQGTRGFVAACKMDDTGTFEVSWGSWGGENAFKRTVEGMDEDVAIPPDVAFIQGSEGGGHPTLARVYVSPRAMNPAMLTAGAEVTPKEAKILAIFQQLKSSYRAEEFDRLQEKDGIEGSRARKEATDREIESLVERGFLSRNKAGAVSITTAGRNAAAKNYY